ncbi:helix-turn-helix transcriptional regulator [Paroceanicella profunda]|uniref:Helix-turn-helix transcriptional regulator n=1 Tax=Paroceanicella profunda TaxID=2579971 RepID=A0A5B8G1T3_9RHOB|nr:helix-turn-helix transcriptional regulator [Paroceanicella profunda]QDL92493.1 helix-turn-helix transcriptional regulator [Paroceanicella profunda]
MTSEEDWGTDDYTDGAATFGDRVTAAREALGLSVAQLSRQLGVKTETILNWEADRSEPRANKLQMLAGVLNVSLVWLMTGEGEAPSVEADGADGVPAPLLQEIRAIRIEQLRLAERLARLLRRIPG